jgi:hypothetical protein
MEVFMSAPTYTLSVKATYESADSLTIFSYVWAAYNLAQLIFFDNWIDDGSILGRLYAALTIAVFLFPGRVRLLAAMVVASIVYNISIWPFVSNHAIADTIISFTILGAIVAVWGRNIFSARQLEIKESEDCFFKFAPVCGAIFTFIYLTIIVSKLNTGFFDLEVSCLSGMIEGVRRPLSFFLSLVDVKFFFWFFLFAEMALPIMLVFRQTRLAAFYFGIPFHIVLGIMGHWTFSGFMIALYVLVAMPSFKEVIGEAFGRLEVAREKLLPWLPGVFLFALANLAVLSSAFILKPSGTWLIWTTIVSTALLYGVLREHFRHGLWGGTGVIQFWTLKPGLLWAALALTVVNSLSPYIGFKTHGNFAMYSNMRSEGGISNHLFIPSLPIFGFQDDLVEIVESNNQDILQLKTHPARYGFIGQRFEVYIPYFEFWRIVSGLKADELEITYLRNGERRQFVRGATDNFNADLDTPPPLILAKIGYYRPVFKGEKSYCQH